MDARDVARLDYLCARARCVPLGIVNDGNTEGRNIGLRHDCDDNGLRSMVAMAEWEAKRSRFSTYYVLHTAPWWNTPECIAAVKTVESLGHEVGLHYNAVAEWWRWHKARKAINPWDVFGWALDQLRSWATVKSIAGHGDPACYEGKFLNYGMFGIEAQGWRSFESLTGWAPRTLADYDLDFHAELTPRSCYISDSGGTWTHDLCEVVKDFPYETNTIILQHPDWYEAGLFE